MPGFDSMSGCEFVGAFQLVCKPAPAKAAAVFLSRIRHRLQVECSEFAITLRRSYSIRKPLRYQSAFRPRSISTAIDGPPCPSVTAVGVSGLIALRHMRSQNEQSDLKESAFISRIRLINLP